MLDKLKDANSLRKAQSQIKKEMEQIYVTEESRGVTIRVRGDKKIDFLEIEGEENKELRDVLNKAFKKVDKKVEKQMRGQLGDLGFPGL
ncbi:YbaB/EbfC family nucleoid-associated protein [Patescibacteria group bacterium]